MRTITLPDFLTPAQINKAKALYRLHKTTGRFATVCAELVIQPNIEQINNKLGQENDPKYLAYACEAVFSQAGVE